MEMLYGAMTVVGPILLAGFILFAIIGNRRRSRAERARTEAATRAQYERPDRSGGDIRPGDRQP